MEIVTEQCSPKQLHALQPGIYHASAPPEWLSGQQLKCEDVLHPVQLLSGHLAVEIWKCWLRGTYISRKNPSKIRKKIYIIESCATNCVIFPLSEQQENQLPFFNLSERQAACYPPWKVYLLVR